ncbi:MAG TPA: protein kinase [Gemmatimonadales bacterium]|nr:protein kinase [Gemmatimonadales bacterium]
MSRLAAALADRYRIEHELGAGGMATVYLAHDLRHDRPVALKVLRPELAAVIGAARFLAEIRTTANLQHPHILPLFDSGEADGTVFYVMPYVEGDTLRDRLAAEKQLPIPEAVRITTEVAGALDYAHRHGVIHRDIKPENILLHDGRAMVADFGIALAASRTEGGARMTETGMSLGTPHYMSPEQALGERALDARTDVYALGCVLYEMLTGEPPFTGPTAQAIIAKVMSSEPEPVTTLRKTVPEPVADAVSTAIQKLPADRFASAREFAEALAGAPTTSRQMTGARAVRRPDRPLARLFPWALAVAGFALAAVAFSRAADRSSPLPVRFAFPAEGGEEETPGHSMAITPDGRVIVHAGLASGRRMLFRRDLGQLKSRPIPGTEGGFQPVISPDGRELAFATTDGRLVRVPLDGGAPLPIVAVTTPIGMSWSAAHGLVLGMPSFSDTISGVSLVPATGDSGLRPLTLPDDGMHHDPMVVADGGVALITEFRFGGGQRRGAFLGVVSLDDGATVSTDRPVFSGGGPVGMAGDILVYFGPDRALMAVRFDLPGRRVLGDPVRVSDDLGQVRDAILAPDGTLALRMAPEAFEVVRVDLSGRATPILPDTVGAVTARFSPDGARAIILGDVRGRATLWVYDFATATRSLLEIDRRPGVPVRGPGGIRGQLEWTADGRRFVAGWTGGPAVVSTAADGSDSVTILARFDDRQLNHAVVSPDGRSLALGTGMASGELDILVARLDGDTAAVPFAATSSNEVAPRFSPDGRWVAYASDESGRFEVYVRPYPGPGPRIQVSEGGGGQPVWAREGNRLFYRVDRAMMAAELAVRDGAVRVAGRWMLFEGDWFRADAGAVAPVYDISPDGQYFLMGRALPGSRAEIVVWTHWLEELEQRLGRR